MDRDPYLSLTHGEDFSLEVASGSAPETLVDTKLRQAVVTGVCDMSAGIASLIATLCGKLTFIALDYHPGGCIANSQVKYLPISNQLMQRILRDHVSRATAMIVSILRAKRNNIPSSPPPTP